VKTNKGIYRKFNVSRTDGRDAPGEKHHGCHYFVLDLDHDPFAVPAMKKYALACREKCPELADDIEGWVESQRPCGCRSAGECGHHWGEALVYQKMESK